MYIIVSSNPEAPVAVSRKLHKALNLDSHKNPCGAISISQIKGTNQFAIIRRTPEETFQQQCSLVTPHQKRDRRTPSIFHWTIPSLEFIKNITGLSIVGSKVIKVKPMKLANGMEIFIMQT
jgi:hypothetical protein